MAASLVDIDNSDGTKLLNGRYRRVLRDPKFDKIAINNYDTEFGVVFRPENISTHNPFN